MLDRKDDNGVAYRDHLEEKARRGSERAREELEPLYLPDAVSYLLPWAYRLYGRSGASMAGLLPLSHREITAWADLMKIQLSPLEVDALIELDSVLRDPGEPDEDEPPDPKDHSWPVKHDG